uniref:Uncharacterized protein n=1 Tax=Arundo donax TaxID=35708 RepID=A0A0A9FNW6_ARUDO
MGDFSKANEPPIFKKVTFDQYAKCARKYKTG